jgi:hypothetical protein
MPAGSGIAAVAAARHQRGWPRLLPGSSHRPHMSPAVLLLVLLVLIPLWDPLVGC